MQSMFPDKITLLFSYPRFPWYFRGRQACPLFIELYSDKENLQKAFRNINETYKSYRAGYIYEYNSIYLNVNDVHAGMLAHEMAHAIIDHYMTVRPPSATAEILARYVDSHLTKQGILFPIVILFIGPPGS